MNRASLRNAMLACIAPCAAVVAWSIWHRDPVVRRVENQPGAATEAADRNDRQAELREESEFIMSRLPLLRAAVAAALQRGVPAVTAGATPDSNDEPIREISAAKQRAVMADFWNLTAEEAAALDAASEAPADERLQVMLRLARGEIAERDLNAELQAADARGLKLVQAVLGDERFSEYVSIRGRLEADEPDLSL